jgi:DNA-binding MarR family transcriptional regulator
MPARPRHSRCRKRRARVATKRAPRDAATRTSAAAARLCVVADSSACHRRRCDLQCLYRERLVVWGRSTIGSQQLFHSNLFADPQQVFPADIPDNLPILTQDNREMTCDGQAFRQAIQIFIRIGKGEFGPGSLSEFRYLLRCFLEFSENAARTFGLTPRQHQALLAIKGFPAGRATITDLAERLRIRHHSAVELVDRLAKAGLVSRRFDARDHRRVLLCLTDLAENYLAELSATHLEELARLKPILKRILARS